MFTALIVIAILVLLIVVHELGHFIAAKLFGVRVDEFGVGYPPRAFSFGRWGGTEYTLNWIPFGGFVRLFGDEGGPERGAGSFVDAPRWKQALILVAGVMMNLIAAWALFVGAYSTGILHVVNDDKHAASAQLIVTDVVAGSPADAAGLRPGDMVLKLTDANEAATLTPDGVLAFVRERGGQDIEVEYLHGDAVATSTLRPAHAVVPQESGRPAIGIGLALVTKEALPLAEAMRAATVSTYNAFILVAQGLWTIVSGALQGAPDLSNVHGPVGIVSDVGEAARNGIGYLFSLAAFISINLVIINLIPIPALDGGRIVVVAIESILRRPAPRLAIQVLNALGIALIVMLMLTVTYQDIARLLA